MAANSLNSARCTPLIAAFPKMLFPFLVILPGLIAIALPTQNLAHLAGANTTLQAHLSKTEQTVALPSTMNDVLEGGAKRSIKLPVYGVAVISKER